MKSNLKENFYANITIYHGILSEASVRFNLILRVFTADKFYCSNLYLCTVSSSLAADADLAKFITLQLENAALKQALLEAEQEKIIVLGSLPEVHVAKEQNDLVYQRPDHEWMLMFDDLEQQYGLLTAVSTAVLTMTNGTLGNIVKPVFDDLEQQHGQF